MKFPNTAKIYVYNQGVDMRKSINGLMLMTVEILECRPNSGDIYLFCNKSKDKVKMIFWDRNGYFLVYKRLEKGRFKFQYQNEEEHFEVTHQQLQALLLGIDFQLFAKNSTTVHTEFI